MHNLLKLDLGSGVADIGLVFDAMMSDGEGFSFDYTIRSIDPAETPLPPSWTMMLAGLVALGLFNWRRKRKAAAVVA